MTPLAIAAMLAASAHAVPKARRDFDRAVEMVRVSPTDASLREKVIALAKELRPAPALPPEAYKRMARGAAAVADARSQSDFSAAVLEFEAAAVAAPWWGDVYRNLGIAYEKAGEPKKALAALRLAQLVAPADMQVSGLLGKSAAAAGKEEPAPISALDGLWTAVVERKVSFSEGTTRAADWRASTRPGGEIELRLDAARGVDANNSERFVLRADGAALSGTYLWDGRLPSGRRRCPAMSAVANGTLSPEGDHITLEFRAPLYERDCGPVDRNVRLLRFQ